VQAVNRSLFCLPIFFVLLLNIPSHKADWIRSLITFPTTSKKEKNQDGLRVENRQLRSQLEIAYEFLSGEKRLKEERDLIDQIKVDSLQAKKKRDLVLAKLRAEAVAIQATVVYRDPASWSSSFWIDIGWELADGIIGKNSPVISNGNLVGVIEYVGKRQSRVRLITDSGLKIAVRAARGGIQERELALSAKALLEQLKKHPKWHKADITKELGKWEEALPIRAEEFLLAKGELRGSSAPIFRSLSSHLHGIGFNYEFEDEHGRAQDLRSSIIQEGDLLVTSGMDGVFPQGLPVATVAKVYPLREGAFFHEIEADAVAQNLLDLRSVFVLPPLPSE
jgi:rod shape-determining protein MreC